VNGMMFNLLEECIQRRFDDDTWDALLEAAGAEGAYTPLGAYPDGQIYALIEAAANAFGKPPAEIMRWFGRESAIILYNRYAEFFRRHHDTLSFLVTLNKVIHPEVRAIFPGSVTPGLSFQRQGPTDALVEYRSARKLCCFAEGLIEGIAPYFGERVTIGRPSCRLRGDPICVFQLSIAREGS
jgi:Haem-NO-binding